MKSDALNKTREVAGFVLAGAGVALIPVGWYASRQVWFFSGVLIVVGLALLFTERVAAAEKDVESNPAPYAPPVKQGTPGDIHNYSGWRDGGRSLGGDDGGSDGD